MKLNASPLNVDELNRMPIHTRDGSTTYIGDVAFVHDGAAPQTNMVRVNGARSVLMTGVIVFLIATSSILAWYLTLMQLPQALTAAVIAMKIGPVAVILGIVVVFMLLSIFMDDTAIMIMVVPLLVPAMPALGIDPLHMGVVIVASIGIDDNSGGFSLPFFGNSTPEPAAPPPAAAQPPSPGGVDAREKARILDLFKHP